MHAAPIGHFRISNLVTYASIAAALAAILIANGEGTRFQVGALFAVATLCDLLDGRFARIFTRTEEEQRFGIQIDSLADAIAFGITPIVVLHRTTSDPIGRWALAWYLAALFYLLCALTRLGFYNVRGDDSGFVGLPTTVMGIFWSIWMFAPPTWLSGFALVGLGYLMVAPLRIPRPGAIALIALMAISLVLVMAHAWRGSL